MRIVTFPEADVPRELRAQVVALQDQAWSTDEPTDAGRTHDPALQQLSMLLLDGGRVLSALDILSKEISHRGQRYAASGLSMVVTDHALRGKGYGQQLVKAARETIAASGADLGTFTCDLRRQAFYERAGWQVLIGTVLIGGTSEAPFPSDQFEKVTMARFFSMRARSMRGRSPDAGSSLSGEIDKLW